MSSDSERQESLAPVLSRSPFFLSLTLAFLVCPICGAKSEEESRNLQTMKSHATRRIFESEQQRAEVDISDIVGCKSAKSTLKNLSP